MQFRFSRNAGFLALLAVALTACSGGFGTSPSSNGLTSSTIPPAGARASHSVAVTVTDGAQKLANVPTVLFICTDIPSCTRRDRVLATGKTNAKGVATMNGSFTDNDLVCAGATWKGPNFEKSASKCTNNFPKAITLKV